MYSSMCVDYEVCFEVFNIPTICLLQLHTMQMPYADRAEEAKNMQSRNIKMDRLKENLKMLAPN